MLRLQNLYFQVRDSDLWSGGTGKFRHYGTFRSATTPTWSCHWSTETAISATWEFLLHPSGSPKKCGLNRARRDLLGHLGAVGGSDQADSPTRRRRWVPRTIEADIVSLEGWFVAKAQLHRARNRPLYPRPLLIPANSCSRSCCSSCSSASRPQYSRLLPLARSSPPNHEWRTSPSRLILLQTPAAAPLAIPETTQLSAMEKSPNRAPNPCNFGIVTSQLLTQLITG